MAMPVGERPQTLAGILRWRARTQSDREAFTFIGDAATHRVTYGELAGRAEALARGLAARVSAADGAPGGRVVLACPPGPDFVAAFFACLLAGAVPVPVQPPGRRADAARWQALMNDARPVCVLSAAPAWQPVRSLLDDGLELIDVARPPRVEGDLPDVACEAGALALLQYTSGSTRAPRGVQVTHANLMYNLGQIERRFGHGADSRGVIWLPPFHDMGLIGGILQPVFAGFPVTLMSPATFLRRPLRWLEAIQAARATTSGGPNFAYEYCLRRIAAEDRRRLDLSSWQVAFCGAETVRAGTLQRFADAFADAGFRRAAFLPCYGLAEATLLATSARSGQGGQVLEVDSAALRDHRVQPTAVAEGAQTLVGCGEPADGSTVLIVDPDSAARLPADRVGEIWLRGPGVCAGYRVADASEAAASDATFAARAPEGDGPWLRTGDLGFMHGGQLYVTGRLRDLLVIRGANHAPQDIEATAEAAHDGLVTGACAAFPVEHAGEEVAVLAAEVARGVTAPAQLSEVASAVRRAVSEQHGLQLHALLLLRPGGLPRTPSGKVQRTRTRALFEQQSLEALHVEAATVSAAASGQTDGQADALIAWLREYAAGIDSRLMDERRSLSPPVLLDFGNRGLLGMQVPRELGGLALGHGDTLRIVEQLGAIDSTLALFVGLSNVLGIRPIQRHARAARRDALLPALAAGRELAAFALTEAGAGSHPHAMEAVARPRPGGGWTLHGRKVWSGSAAWASVINVFVRQCDADGNVLGITAFAVPRGRPGLRQGPEALTLGMRAMVQNSVLLDGVPVDETDMLGAPGEGMLVAQDAMMYGRLVIAAACTGGIKRCAQLMLRYAGRRQVAGGLLLDQPVTRERLAQVCAMADALSAFVAVIAARLDDGDALPEELYAAAKILAPELYWQAIDHLTQSLGGRGYIEPNLAPQMMRDARVLRVFEGPTETLAAWLGARALRQPAALQQWLGGQPAGRLAQDALHDLGERAAARPAGVRQAGCAAGIAMAWHLMRSLGEAGVDAATCDWLRASADAAHAAALRAFDHEPAAADDLARRVQSFAADIGDIDPDVAGEDHGRDALLRRGDAPLEVAASTSVPPAPRPAAMPQDDGAREVADWLRAWLARQLGLQAQDIDAHRAFADYGVDSVMAVELVQDLEQAFALSAPLDATLAWNHPTIAAASTRIAALRGTPKPEHDLDALDEDALARLLEAELSTTSVSSSSPSSSSR
jgi:acyl-CoA synthetase (AMP-forming)/AMP-acid ligase II/alkylation response protein AidB-like acyl-CoA dehydrogenase/acyl carrier protein